MRWLLCVVLASACLGTPAYAQGGVGSLLGNLTPEQVMQARLQALEKSVMTLKQQVVELQADKSKALTAVDTLREQVLAESATTQWLLIEEGGKCPKGFKLSTSVGLLGWTASVTNQSSLKKGAPYSSAQWTWLHPVLCLRVGKPSYGGGEF